MRGSAASTVSRGMTATPTPAATRPCTSGCRSSGTPSAARCPRRGSGLDGSIERHVAEADERLRRRSRAASASARGERRVRPRRSARRGRAAARPSRAARRRRGSSTKPTSISPRSTAAAISSSSSSSSITSICGHCVGEPPHDLRQHPRADRLEGADAERARLAGAQRVQVGLRGLEARDDRVGVAQQQPPRLGQRDGPRAARPLDEPLADDPLERRDLLADRRLRVAEPLGGPAERALVRERLQRGEVAELDAEPYYQVP